MNPGDGGTGVPLSGRIHGTNLKVGAKVFSGKAVALQPGSATIISTLEGSFFAVGGYYG